MIVDTTAVRGVEVRAGRLRARAGGDAGRRREHGLRTMARGADRLLAELRRARRRRAGARRRAARCRATLFVPADLRRDAWDNVPLPIGCGQTISQPLVVARMCELLELRRRRAGARRRHRLRLPRRAAGAAGARTSTASSCTPSCPSARGAAWPRPGSRTSRWRSATARAACPSTRPTTRSTSPRPRGAGSRRRSSTSSPRAAGWSRRSRTATSGSCCCAGRGGRSLHRLERVRFVPLRSADEAEAGLGRYSRPTFAHGLPSTITTSAVKSLAPRISDEPTP